MTIMTTTMTDQTQAEALRIAREALQFYADQSHFIMHQPDVWDTVSGEPPNYWEDEENTATVEDGSIAKLALAEIDSKAAIAAIAAPVEQAPVKTIAWACIVDGAWHGSFKHEIDAKEAGFSTGKRFDLLPLCFAFEVDALQAKIDALMLEYCTEEMTAEQSKEWEKHQRPWVEPTPQAHTVAVEWMPIEKAPKDGSKIILGCPENEDQAAVSTIGWWQEAEEDGIDYMGADAGFVDFEFQVFNPGRSFGNRQYVAAQPTHYMPLPAAPTAQEYHSKSICNTINQPHRDGLTD